MQMVLNDTIKQEKLTMNTSVMQMVTNVNNNKIVTVNNVKKTV